MRCKRWGARKYPFFSFLILLQDKHGYVCSAKSYLDGELIILNEGYIHSLDEAKKVCQDWYDLFQKKLKSKMHKE
jgi:hypothetical protein